MTIFSVLINIDLCQIIPAKAFDCHRTLHPCFLYVYDMMLSVTSLCPWGGIPTHDKPRQKRHRYDENHDGEGNANSHKSSLNEQNHCLDHKQNTQQQGDYNQRKPARFFHFRPLELLRRASCTSAAYYIITNQIFYKRLSA